MLLVADVHAASDLLAHVVNQGETLLVLGDLVNLIDYRTGEGIIADVVGIDTVTSIATLRGQRRFDEASRVWTARVAGIEDRVRDEVATAMARQYEQIAQALDGADAYVTYGNVDRPEMLEASLPPSARYVDAEVVEIEGWRVGFVGGGVPKLGTDGEVSPAAMKEKLDRIGPVDVLCSHVPPAIEPLSRDVIGGGFKGSDEILGYIDEFQPAFHFFGDIHQPQAVQWRRGSTVLRNVGYFRATGRPFRFVRSGDGDTRSVGEAR